MVYPKMYIKNVIEYKNLSPIAYVISSGYNHNTIEDTYKPLISESKCMCRGTCRTGIGCTCK